MPSFISGSFTCVILILPLIWSGCLFTVLDSMLKPQGNIPFEMAYFGGNLFASAVFVAHFLTFSFEKKKTGISIFIIGLLVNTFPIWGFLLAAAIYGLSP